MRILQYGNRKMEPIAWDASTPELEAVAFLALFQYFNGNYWQMYKASPLSGRQKALYARAMDGDAGAAKKLLELRKDYEYENWSLIDYDDWKAGKLEDMYRQREAELRD